jgi:hypothetical protein
MYRSPKNVTKMLLNSEFIFYSFRQANVYNIKFQHPVARHQTPKHQN